MHSGPDMSLWSGRSDEGEAARWHQCVTPLAAEPQPAGVALLGVASDEGVRRNRGRVGAAAGPDAIRKALANQAWHLCRPVYDAGNLSCEGGRLEELQAEQAALVETLLRQGHFPLVLGGGHEIAYGNFFALDRHLAADPSTAPIGIINLDAHFDLRPDPKPNSGTGFMQMAAYCRDQQQPFHYACLGISEVANSRQLFAEAQRLGGSYLRDEQLNSGLWTQVEQRLTAFIRPCRALYLSIDLDLLPAATAPGVSAPAGRGVPLPVVEQLLGWIRTCAGERLRLADIAEYNPHYDSDGRTARVAARLCHLLCC